MNHSQRLLEELISIPSHGENDPDREKDMVKYLKDYVTEKFPEMEVIEVTKSGYANLLCLGSRSPKILLACHMDTVPPSKENHTTLEVVGDKAYGLGTKDMKGGIVSSLLALDLIKEKENIGVIFYSDEEYSQKGILGTLEVLPTYLEKNPKIIISPESRFNIGYGARGIIVLDVEVKGQKSHSARPQLGRDAILGFFDAITTLKESIAKATELGETTTIITKIEGGLLTENNLITYHSGSIPDFVRAQISIRNSQVDLNSSQVVEKLKSILAEKDLSISNHTIVADHGARYVDQSKIEKMVSFAESEMQLTIDMGDPTLAGYNDAELLGKVLQADVINFGPNGGENHTRDEWVSINSIEDVARIFALWTDNIDKLI